MGQNKDGLSYIVWAMDPFSKSDEGRKKAVESLKVIVEATGAKVQPVHVLGADNLHWIGNVMPPQVEKFVPIAQKQMEKILDGVSIPNLLPGEVVVNHKNSKRMDIVELLKFSNEKNADLIVMNTHARTGAARFFIGSFAESALLKADIPLFMVSPHMKSVNSLDKALFPTDFSDFSKKAFQQFLGQTKDFVKEVTLFNEIPHPIDAFVQTGVATVGGGWVTIEQFMKSEAGERQKMAEEIASQSKKIKTLVKIDDSPGSIPENILKQAHDENFNFIAMSAESGAFSSVAIGSIARYVIRHAEVPVWVSYRPGEDN